MFAVFIVFHKWWTHFRPRLTELSSTSSRYNYNRKRYHFFLQWVQSTYITWVIVTLHIRFLNHLLSLLWHHYWWRCVVVRVYMWMGRIELPGCLGGCDVQVRQTHIQVFYCWVMSTRHYTTIRSVTPIINKVHVKTDDERCLEQLSCHWTFSKIVIC